MSTPAVKRVILPSAGILPGNKFISIKVGQEEAGGAHTVFIQVPTS